MRSTPSQSKKGGRVLLLFGQGLIATQALDLLFLFSQAGFSVYSALPTGGPTWVTADSIRQVSGHAPSSATVPASWAVSAGPFDISVGVGLPPSTLKDLAWSASADPALQLLERPARIRLLLQDASSAPSDEIARSLKNRGWEFVFMPGEYESRKQAFHTVFADTIAVLQQRNRLKERTIRWFHSAPSLFEHLTAALPSWRREFVERAARAGFSPATDQPSPDLQIETYEGPFVSKSLKTRTEITFDPLRAPPLPEAGFTARFVHPSAPEKSLAGLVNEKIWLIARHPNGDLTVHEPHEVRLIPEVTGRPALYKLLELLIERLEAVL